MLERIERQSEENYTFQAGCVTIAQCIEYRGYTNGSGFLFAEDSEPVLYHLIFTLEITERKGLLQNDIILQQALPFWSKFPVLQVVQGEENSFYVCHSNTMKPVYCFVVVKQV